MELRHFCNEHSPSCTAGKEYSRDRFVRASHLVDAAKRGTDVDAGVAQLLSFQRAVSGHGLGAGGAR